jgi:DNA-binding MarR family transcriptional regulator
MAEASKTSTRDIDHGDMTRIVDSIRALVKALRDSGRDTEQRLGITSAQLYVLQELREKPASINELAMRTYTHQSSVSMVVARLVESKLVSRTASRNDARKVSISLTNAGRALIRKVPDASQTRLVSGLREMSRTDLRSLASNLETLTQIMADQEEAGTAKERSSAIA